MRYFSIILRSIPDVKFKDGLTPARAICLPPSMIVLTQFPEVSVAKNLTRRSDFYWHRLFHL